jgi:ectoine hydroxylase-related dioxygenase (phytanoyl-CoA dioxygenase family)
MHPAIWPLVKELTADMPRFVSGTLSYEQHNPDRQQVEKNPAGLHCAREGRYWYTRYQVKDGRIFCNDLVFFFYLTDVNPGDGGLIVIPGSHKSQFERPDELLTPRPDGIDPEPDLVFTNLTPKAGDFLCISELLTHGALNWKPTDRSREMLILRYCPQYEGKASLPQEVIDRLSPETQELVSSAPYGQIKDIISQDPIALTV